MRTEDEHRYELIIGQRRLLACKQAGLQEIPALVCPELTEQEATIRSFAENIHRLDLEYRDKMQVTMELLRELGSVDAVAKALGISPSAVRNYVGYAAVPDEIKKLVDEDRLAATTALRVIRSIPDAEKAIKIAEQIVELPRAADRKHLIEVAAEHPEEDTQGIQRIAKQQKRLFESITIHITPRVALALEKACLNYESSREEIASNALEEWLADKGFIA
jgi:ParB/RepB/Spo0J family partition protein